MRVALIDDEEIALDVLEILLKQIDGIQVVGKFTDPNTALNQLKTLEVDVVFLDMEMGEFHGLKFAEKLMIKKYDLEIVFVTAFSQYALEAFEVNAIDYLLKPVNMDRLKKTILKLQERNQKYVRDRVLLETQDDNLFAYTMGSFRIMDCQSNLIKWRTKKVKELFAYLWHHQEKPMCRTRIIEDLWPYVTADKAATLLHTTVYQLRKTIKEITNINPIILMNEQYILKLDIKSDLLELRNILQADEINNSNIERVLELYQGDYLEEENYPWALYEQQKLRQSFLKYLEKYLSIARQENKLTSYIENCLVKMLQLDPYNERYAYLLMEYYGEINDKTKLINLYTSFRINIKEELGINLQREAIELYRKYIDY